MLQAAEEWNDIPQEKQAAFLQHLINFVLDDVRKGVSGENETPLFKVIDERTLYAYDLESPLYLFDGDPIPRRIDNDP